MYKKYSTSFFPISVFILVVPSFIVLPCSIKNFISYKLLFIYAKCEEIIHNKRQKIEKVAFSLRRKENSPKR